ncbi:hypothetical protein BS50DRAFT_555069 [Corynespora cassiicola Philippines]|uniref:Rhodopsin domain-containing protein n=1 Tax=Corynespora cassiicola Philippines TaxID=1448308 RepID=A0A2T2NHX4_CORCC|nr:hypothetical protein BS50DRAFT_555069 [Corynespora cassiicola Philippines]
MSTVPDPSLTPVIPPPPGITPNFDNPPTLMPVFIAGTIIIHFFTIPFLVARLFAIIFVTRAVKLEDYLCYLSYLGCIAYTVAIAYTETIGLARHMWDVSYAMLPDILRLCNVVFCCYTATGGLAKAVVFLQLKRIFTTAHREVVFWVIIGSLIVNCVFYIIMLFLYVFTCWPREKIWNPMIEGTCLDSNKLNMAMGTLNVISDVQAFALPAWAIWKLNMEFRRKISVFAVFGVGAVAVAIGCVGLYYRVILLQQADFTWLLTQAGLICMAELNIVIIVGCCPYVPRVLRHTTSMSTSPSSGAKNSYTYKHGSSFKSKLNTFNKYMGPDAGISKLGTEPGSEERLEMHRYAEESGIVKTTLVSQSVAPK